MKKILSIIALAYSLTVASDAPAESSDLRILGWVENVFLVDPGIEIKAKLDTGAETSSLDAHIIKKFRKGGKRWVRFSITDRETFEEFVLVRQRVRTIGIVQHEGKNQIRPVVKVEVCVDGATKKIEVSLIERSGFNYPLLLGRSALESFALVDPGSTFLAESDCHFQNSEGDGS